MFRPVLMSLNRALTGFKCCGLPPYEFTPMVGLLKYTRRRSHMFASTWSPDTL